MASIATGSLESAIGRSPLLGLDRIGQDDWRARDNRLFAKFEGSNPGGSVKDRAAMSMLIQAELQGTIRPGDKLVEATSGNTGVALAMACAARGYKLAITMPEGSSIERRQTMQAYGATVIATPRDAGMEGARDYASAMVRDRHAYSLDQFSNPANPAAHYETTGPEIWDATQGRVTHFVSAMGTTGTIMGTGRFLKSRNPQVELIGVQPKSGACISGIRRWAPEYTPPFFDAHLIDKIMEVTEVEAHDAARRLAREEGLFCGPSSGGALHAALALSKQVRGAVIVFVACDRGDRYLSTGIY